MLSCEWRPLLGKKLGSGGSHYLDKPLSAYDLLVSSSTSLGVSGSPVANPSTQQDEIIIMAGQHLLIQEHWLVHEHQYKVKLCFCL